MEANIFMGGFVLGIVFGAFVMGMIVITYQHEQAAKTSCAQFNPVTSAFEWLDPQPEE